jgi:hypothetical protein
MSYLYEGLSPERFQEFCQALLVSKFPNVQCLPVAQPDGGRDAFVRNSRMKQSESIIFQVKFARTPEEHKEERFIQEIVKKEGAGD